MDDVAPLDNVSWGLPDVALMPGPRDGDAFSETPIFDLLRAAAARAPEAVALASQAGKLRYADLWRLAQNAAHAIAALVPPGAPVGCLLSRTPEAIAGLLGCLISGRIALILDPANPAERLAALLEDAAPALLLLDRAPTFQHAIPELPLSTALAGPDRAWPADRGWDPDAPLAVHFTSGSTGRPKGIVLSARSVLYRALETVEMSAVTPNDRVFAPSIFIQSSGLSLLLGSLARGARVVLANLSSEGAGAVLKLLAREAITVLSIPPPVLRMLLSLEQSAEAFRAVRSLRTGSMALARGDLALWRPRFPPWCEIAHTYASTEALYIAWWIVPADDSGAGATLPVGAIRSSHEHALLTEDDRPASPGEPGELVLRSRYLALGEWQAGRLVAGRMPPAAGKPGWRVFRTGDVVAIQSDGMLRVAGRADRQIKINGVRVEPGEIEAVLRGEAGVTDAAVVSIAGAAGITLCGFVAAAPPDEAALIAALRRRLSAALPAALRPSRLFVLDRLPTLAAGKTDYVALRRLVGA